MPQLLIVNDDLQQCRSLTEVLTSAGYNTDCVCDASGALTYQQTLPADLVILMMPVSSADCFALIKDISEGFATPILLISTSTNEQDMLTALKAGADKYLLVPYATETLLMYINVLLRRVTLEKQRLAFHHCDQLFSLKISRLPLTGTETQLVQYLSKHNGMTISKATLQKEVLKKELCVFDRNLYQSG